MGLVQWRLPESRDAPAGAAQSSIDGRLEAVRDGVVSGWVWAPADPAARIKVSVLVDGEEVASATAAIHRRRLETAGIGDGAHAFEVALPRSLADGAAHRLAVLAGPGAEPLQVDRTFVEEAAAESPFRSTRFEVSDARTPGPSAPERTQAAVAAPERPRVPVPAAGGPERGTALTARLGRLAPGARTAPVWVLAGACLAYLLVMAYLTRRLSFFQDDYYILIDRRGWSPTTLLSPVNSHLFVTQMVFYKALFATIGLRTFWPYQVPVLLSHVALVVALYILGARRGGRWVALVPALLMLVNFAGYEDQVWALQFSISGGIAACLYAVLCLERGDRRGEIWATLLLILALSWFSVCLFIALALGIVLAFTNWRRLWVVIVPLALYALWYAAYGQSDIVWSNLPHVPSYVAHIAAYGFAGLLGMSSSVFGYKAEAVGYVLLALSVAWIVRQAIRRRLTSLTVLGVLTALAFWVGTALARAQYGEPDASRYLYQSDAFILLAAAGALRPWRLRSVRLRWGVLSAGLAAFVAIVAVGQNPMRSYVDWRTTADALVRVQLGATDVAGPAAQPNYLIDNHLMGAITAQQWQATVRDLGSDGFGIAKIRTMPVWYQQAADATLAGSEGISVKPGPKPRGASCVQVYPGQSPQTVSVRPGGVVYVTTARTATASVWLRRVSGKFAGSPSLTLGRDTSGTIGFPRDLSSLPWSVGLTVPDHGRAPLAEICSAG